MAHAIEIDPYVFDVLMPDLVGHDRHPSAFVLYLYFWRRTGGGRHASGEISLATMAEDVGLSKRAVQIALARLQRRQLVTSARSSAATPHSVRLCRPWVRSSR